MTDILALARGCAAAALVVLSGCGGGGEKQGSVHPQVSRAYVTNAASNTISMHEIASGGTALSGVRATAPAGASPLSIDAHPSGKFLYAANFLSFDVSAYAVAVDGTLTPVQAPISTGAGFNPSFVSVHPSGRFAYVATILNNPSPAKVTPYAIDATTGVLSSAGNGAFAGVVPTSLAIVPAGTFAYVTDSVGDAVWTLAIDPTTGSVTNINPDEPTLAGSGPVSIAVDGSGRFAYVANLESNDVSSFTINAATGGLTPNGGAIAAGVRPTSIVIHPSNGFAYVANAGSNDISIYKVDAGSGLLSPGGKAVPAGTIPRSITLDSSGEFAFVVNSMSNDISVYAIDAATGSLTPVGERVPTGQLPTAMAIVTRSP